MAQFSDLPIEIRLMIIRILKLDYAWRQRILFARTIEILDRKILFHQWRAWQESQHYTRMHGRLYTLVWYWYPLEMHKRRFVMYKIDIPNNNNMQVSFSSDNELYWDPKTEIGKTFY